MKNNIDIIDLSSDIADVEAMVSKLRFLLSELDVYDLDHEVTPYKAIQFARNENKAPDCELSYTFCFDHKRIMYLYNIMRDYAFEVGKMLEKVQKSLN